MLAYKKFEACPRCKEYAWDDSCRCELYQVAHDCAGDPDEQDWNDRYGRSPEDVAKRFAEWLDSNGDYRIVSGDDTEVWVRDCSNVITKWIVSGESVPTYYCNPKSDLGSP